MLALLYAPSATGYSELQPRACGTVFRPLSLLPAHSRLSKDNWKLFCSRTHFPSFSFILIVYRVLEAFSLNATLIFTLIIMIEACPLFSSDNNSLDFVISRFFVKLFKTNNIEAVTYCCMQFNFDLPSTILKKKWCFARKHRLCSKVFVH